MKDVFSLSSDRTGTCQYPLARSKLVKKLAVLLRDQASHRYEGVDNSPYGPPDGHAI